MDQPIQSPESVGQSIRTVNQEEALLILMPGPATAYSIGQNLHISHGTLQPMLRTMIEAGFVTRTGDTEIRDLGAGRQTVARPLSIAPEMVPALTTYFEEKALRILQALRALHPERRI